MVFSIFTKLLPSGLSAVGRGVLKYSTRLLVLSVSPCSSNTFYFIHFEALLLDTHKLLNFFLVSHFVFYAFHS